MINIDSGKLNHMRTCSELSSPKKKHVVSFELRLHEFMIRLVINGKLVCNHTKEFFF